MTVVDREAARPGESFDVDRLMISSPFLRPPERDDCVAATLDVPRTPDRAVGDPPVGIGFADVGWNRKTLVEKIRMAWSYPAGLDTRAQALVGMRALNGHSGENWRVLTLNPCLAARDEDNAVVEFCLPAPS